MFSLLDGSSRSAADFFIAGCIINRGRYLAIPLDLDYALRLVGSPSGQHLTMRT